MSEPLTKAIFIALLSENDIALDAEALQHALKHAHRLQDQIDLIEAFLTKAEQH